MKTWPSLALALLPLVGCGASGGLADGEAKAPSAASGAHLAAMPDWLEGESSPVSPESTKLAPVAVMTPVTPETPVNPKTTTISLGELGGPPKKTYSTRLIDLDVKDADLHDVCRLLAEVGKVNIVVADDVKGSVTLKLKRVPWDRALEVILRAKGYAQERDGNIILVGAAAK